MDSFEIETKNFITQDIEIGSDSYIEYLKLISPDNEMQIDPGEAAAIIIARESNGTMASNNLKDILHYVKTEEPPYICTDNILYMALKDGIITANDGMNIWNNMKKKRRALPKYDFLESVRRFDNNLPR